MRLMLCAGTAPFFTTKESRAFQEQSESILKAFFSKSRQNCYQTIIMWNWFAFRQLGFSSGNPHSGSYYGDVSTGTFAMDNVRCTGSEQYLQYCSYSSTDDCDVGDGAGVYCYDWDHVIKYIWSRDSFSKVRSLPPSAYCSVSLHLQ